MQILYRADLQSQKLTNLMHKILFYNKFYFMPLHVSSTCAHHQEVKIVLHSLWYHHTETSEWCKITKIQFYKYEHIVVKFMCEFFGCDYCVILTVNLTMSCRSYVYPVIKLIRKILCLFIFMFAFSM